MTVEQFEEVQCESYNKYLNVKVYETLGRMDGYQEYRPPKCFLKDGAMAFMLDMFLFKRYEQLGMGYVPFAWVFNRLIWNSVFMKVKKFEKGDEKVEKEEETRELFNFKLKRK